MTLRVLYDGWTLAREPGSPAALHLLALLASLDADILPLVALPAASVYALPASVSLLLKAVSESQVARLAWEQRVLPALAAETGVDLLHLTSFHAPLSSRIPLAISPAEPRLRWRGEGGTSERIRAALAAGLQSGAGMLLWPQDLPGIPGKSDVYRLPPLAALPAAQVESAQAAPEPGYVLYHGAGEKESLRALLMGWSWATDAIGEYAPLLLAGLSASQRAQAAALADQGGFRETIQFAAECPDWQALYRDAALLVSVSPALPWGDPVAQAMAAGKAIAAVDEPFTAARVGTAAYLTPPGDDRALGAAIITLAVETEMADDLGAAAAQRAAQWRSQDFPACLEEAYRKISARQ